MERRHRHILETTRAIKFQGGLPSKFWSICVEAAVYIINRIPSTVLHNKSPYEMLFHRVPTLDHMRIIGYLCYATRLPKQDKFGARAIKVVMMGYGDHQKGYRLYDLENNTFFTSRDVAFFESIFPFQSSQASPFPISPIMSNMPPIDDLVPCVSISSRHMSQPSLKWNPYLQRCLSLM